MSSLIPRIGKECQGLRTRQTWVCLIFNEPVGGDAVLVRYTYHGDANFNGKVDGADYARIDGMFNQQSTLGNISGWYNGDFDGNGKIDGADYALIDAAFNSQGTALRPAAAGSKHGLRM
jgi:hypothetical protein